MSEPPDWGNDARLQATMAYLGEQGTEHQLRLLVCAVGRVPGVSWHLEGYVQGSPRHERAAVHLAERYADGGVTADEFAAAAAELMGTYRNWYGDGAPLPCYAVAQSIRRAWRTWNWHLIGATIGSKAALLAIARDIFGRPPVVRLASPRWLTPDVASLAPAAYRAVSDDQLPVRVLGDLLLDAGCDDEELVRHCLGGGPHVKGCWALDLLTRTAAGRGGTSGVGR